MTQTPLEAEEAAGTVAASADLAELDPTAEALLAEEEGDEEGRAEEGRPDGAAPWTDVDEASLEAGPVSLKARMRHTPQGLLAAGALVTGILLATTALVWVATASPRRHPWATAWALHRRR